MLGREWKSVKSPPGTERVTSSAATPQKRLPLLTKLLCNPVPVGIGVVEEIFVVVAVVAVVIWVMVEVSLVIVGVACVVVGVGIVEEEVGVVSEVEVVVALVTIEVVVMITDVEVMEVEVEVGFGVIVTGIEAGAVGSMLMIAVYAAFGR